MFKVRRKPDLRTISTLIRCYSLAKRSHYEVLNLRRNCTDKEIKEAFIHMSKEYHPDKNKDVKAQENFVRIVEAYNVLGKPNSRAQYDNLMEFESPASHFGYHRTNQGFNYRYNPHYNHTYTHYESRTRNTSHAHSYAHAKDTQEKEKTYYGVRGLRKMPNYMVIMLCFGIAFFGTMMQIFIIRELYVVHQRQAQERSRYLSEELDRVRAAAHGNGNEVQTRLLLEKIVAAANPTVTTASLGQALANEKKGSSESLLTEFGITEVSDDVEFYITNSAQENFRATDETNY